MRKFIDTVQDHRGNGIVGAMVVIRLYPSDDLATIYSDNGITLIVDSEVETDSRGQFEFYVGNGRYTFEISGEGISNRRIEDIVITDSTAFIEGEGIVVALGEGDGTYTTRTLVSTSGALVITNPSGVAGPPSFALHSSLQDIADEGGVPPNIIVVALEDSGSFLVAVTAGVDKGVWESFPGGTILEIWAGCKDGPVGADLVIDVNIAGVSIMAVNKLRIEAGETETSSAAVQPALTTTVVPHKSRVSMDYDSTGTACKGVIVYLAYLIDTTQYPQP